MADVKNTRHVITCPHKLNSPALGSSTQLRFRSGVWHLGFAPIGEALSSFRPWFSCTTGNATWPCADDPFEWKAAESASCSGSCGLPLVTLSSYDGDSQFAMLKVSGNSKNPAGHGLYVQNYVIKSGASSPVRYIQAGGEGQIGVSGEDGWVIAGGGKTYYKCASTQGSAAVCGDGWISLDEEYDPPPGIEALRGPPVVASKEIVPVIVRGDFYFYDKVLNFEDAQVFCSARKMVLASICSAAERGNVTRDSAEGWSGFPKSYWIGYRSLVGNAG